MPVRHEECGEVEFFAVSPVQRNADTTGQRCPLPQIRMRHQCAVKRVVTATEIRDCQAIAGYQSIVLEDGFVVDLCYLAREELLKLRSKCLKQKFNKKTRAFEEQLDEDTFLVEYVSSVIKNWTGLKYDYLRQLILIETDNLNLEDELPFSKENAEILMKNSGDFDTWVTETVGDLENFTMIK